jgi:signal transduction histidine kinase/ActR/RegA family two-component response regulator
MSVDPGLIRAEPHTEIGLVIQRDAGMLLERWGRRAAQEQPTAPRVHHQVLFDHLAELLRALGRSLANSEGPDTHQHFLPAANHGEQRWESGWSLPEVVRDFQILRLVILDYLEEALERTLGHRETMAIGLALDDAITASITMYVKNRDEHFRQLEEQRVELDRRVQEQLRSQAETLREVDRRKNEFLATLGHELRNPLAPLWNAVRVLELQAMADPTLRQTRSIINRQVQQMTRLVDDLLDISRIAQDKIALRKEHVDLTTVAAQAAQTSAPHLTGRHHELEVTVPTVPIWLEADSIRLVQIIVNLLNNAAKYTEPGGHVWLTVVRETEEAVIRVRDSGMGIAPEMLPHVFDLFTQAEWAVDRSQGGMGIGLALVRRLIDLHGGTITAHSAGVGQGSEFVVRLPALPAQTVPGERPKPTDEERCDAAVSGCRVLIVDDNVDAAVTLGMLLGAGGHEVRLAHDGPLALKTADTFRPQVVLLDIGMPRMDGYEVAQRLREEPALAKVFLVALTGYGQDEDRRRSQEAGFDAHLVKPLDLDALHLLLARCSSTADGQTSG